MVTKTELKKLFPGAKAALVDAVVNNWPLAEAAGINKPRRIRQFLANVGVETGGLTSIAESLNYSVAGLLSTFSRQRISEADAKKYGRSGNRKANQQAIANTIYGGAWGKKNLGNTQPNDGWDMRGSGFGQVTGRANFATIERETGMPVLSNPELLRDPDAGMKATIILWEKWTMNDLADANKTVELRKKWNGGNHGLADVKAYLVKAEKIWPDDAVMISSSAAPVVSIDIYDGKANDTVRTVQTRLNDLGYFEFGKVDGKWGPRTAGTITTFQADNGLDLDPKISEALLASLMVAPKRTVAPARANATVADLREEGTVEIKQTDQTKVAGYAFAGLGAFTGGQEALEKVKGTSETVRSIWDTLQPIQNLVVNNLWIILLAGGGFFVWKSGLLQKIRLTKHQKAEDVSH